MRVIRLNRKRILVNLLSLACLASLWGVGDVEKTVYSATSPDGQMRACITAEFGWRVVDFASHYRVFLVDQKTGHHMLVVDQLGRCFFNKLWPQGVTWGQDSDHFEVTWFFDDIGSGVQRFKVHRSPVRAEADRPCCGLSAAPSGAGYQGGSVGSESGIFTSKAVKLSAREEP